MSRAVARCALAFLAVGLLAGASACDTSGTDKAGNEVLVLHLATIDLVDNNGRSFGPAEFVRALSEVSGDRIRVEVETDWGGGAADAEADLITAIARGEVDGGWPATRAFAAAGVRGLAAIEAPFAIPSYAAETLVVESEAADRALAGLDGTGLVGLGLTLGPLRRPFSAEGYLTAPADFEGTTFRTYNSPTEDAVVNALGGTPRSVGQDWPAEIRTGSLDAIEFDLAQYLASNYRRQAPYVTSNVVLWPKMYLLTMSQTTWDTLSNQQRAWIEESADLAVRASIDGDYAENDVANQLCQKGVRFRDAQAGDLLALKAAVTPVLRRLAADPEEGPLLRDIRRATGDNPPAEPILLPGKCYSGMPAVEQTRTPTTLAPVPDGTYRTQITEGEVAAAGLLNNEGISGTWTLKVEDGRYELSCRPLASPGLDCGHAIYAGPLDAGELRGDDHVLWWVYLPARLAEEIGCELPPSDTDPTHCAVGQPPYSMNWEINGDNLVFSHPTGGAGETTLKPFVRID